MFKGCCLCTALFEVFIWWCYFSCIRIVRKVVKYVFNFLLYLHKHGSGDTETASRDSRTREGQSRYASRDTARPVARFYRANYRLDCRSRSTALYLPAISPAYYLKD